jgi:hypothetical protein
VNFSSFCHKENKEALHRCTVSKSKWESSLKFARKVRRSSMLMWPQTDYICEIWIEDIGALFPELMKNGREVA